MKRKLGADPELFMADINGQLKSACGRIGGSKEHPQPMGLGDGFFIQEDNVAIEFNIPASSNAKDFREAIQKALQNITDNVQQMYKFQVVNLSAAVFPDEELASDAAKVFGCDPDFNAWTERVNPKPKASNPNLRSCGGHVHVGLEHPEAYKPETIIKAMDLYLGVPSVLMDTGELRKQLYGKAGAFRKKPYGVEYRVLSNYWVFNGDLIDWVWNNTGKALNAVDTQLVDFDNEKEAILTAIDGNDKSVAEALCKKYNLEVLHV